MKHLLLFLSLPLLLSACSSSKPAQKSAPVGTMPKAAAATTPTGNVQLDYIQTYKDAAIYEMQRAGIPASITLAQGILESASGQSELATQANNHFGIKCGNAWSGRSYHKKDDERNGNGQLVESCFRKYNAPAESFFDHSEFLRDPRKSNRYGFLFNLDKRDYRSWARGLQSAGYATSGTYANQLIDLIERLRLYEYDQPGGVEVEPGGVIPASAPPQSRIGRVNDVKVVNSREGETIADIARIYRLQPDKVADYNDRAYSPGQHIPTGTRIFIQGKKSSWHGQATQHFVREGQSMLEIAQLYGIKLDELLKRNGMQRGQEPAANEKIRLRGKRSSGENIRLRSTDEESADPTPVDAATAPASMTPDENVLFEMTPNEPKTNKPSKPADSGVFTGKPATTGVPYPSDPGPATTTTPTPQNMPPANPQANKPAPATGPYHLVVKGDTLYNISRRYGISVARLKQLNNMADDNIKIGQTLRVQ
ncbi:MAG: LysM peptidoglycan-binding domain-containing protein [Saprospirales bacterium]|nr:LysM peptidoglycan-binding domain-containing protein [Saprospirales bacterium]MBK8923275.1 LysM peptidoglycan-binding domain-containing protein [Saprospirales bacterium]